MHLNQTLVGNLSSNIVKLEVRIMEYEVKKGAATTFLTSNFQLLNFYLIFKSLEYGYFYHEVLAIR
jgi:hypothetical protein